MPPTSCTRNVGTFSVNGGGEAPLALSAITATERRHRAVHQEDALGLLRDHHEPEAGLDEMILSSIADTAKRRRLISALQASAVPWQVPGFELIQR